MKLNNIKLDMLVNLIEGGLNNSFPKIDEKEEFTLTLIKDGYKIKYETCSTETDFMYYDDMEEFITYYK